MNYFTVPYKVDWLNLAVIDPGFGRQVLADCIVSDVESCFNAERQHTERGYNNYDIRHPVGFFKDKNYSHVANVSYGGNTSGKLGEHVQLSITGSDSDFYHRNSQMHHDLAYIQRLDLAYDVTGDYKDIINTLAALKDLSRLKWSTVSSTDGGVTSTTTYIGSRESAFFVRVYEKGKQVGGDPDWVRVEFEIKPMKTSSDFAVWCYEQYKINPENILTRCKFTHCILTALMGDGRFQAYTPRMEKRLPETVASFTHMIEQYSSVLSGLSELYEVQDLLSLAQKIHRLKQNESKEVRNLVPQVINDYLEERQKTALHDAHVRAFRKASTPV